MTDVGALASELTCLPFTPPGRTLQSSLPGHSLAWALFCDNRAETVLFNVDLQSLFQLVSLVFPLMETCSLYFIQGLLGYLVS